MGGKKIRMEYFFRVLETVVANESEDDYDEFCPKKVRVWKISSLTDASGKDVVAAVADATAHPGESNTAHL
jgi:hypothetical protein